MTSTPEVYRMEEVKNHKDVKSAWIVIHNKVYDVTKFLEEVSCFLKYIFWKVLLGLFKTSL